MKVLNGTTIDGNWDLGSDWGIGPGESGASVLCMPCEMDMVDLVSGLVLMPEGVLNHGQTFVLPHKN
jgi:hypothetical protein